MSTQVIMQKGSDYFMAIDRYSMRKQIVTKIESEIFSDYKVGDKLPSESEFANRFGVTRSTIQKALKDLENMSLIQRVQGKGSFVSMRRPKVKMFNFKGFSDYARSNGYTPLTKVISKELREENGTSYLVLTRLRAINTKNETVRLTLDESKLDLDYFNNLDQYDLANNSLYAVLQKEYGISPEIANLHMSAISATKEQANLLNCLPGDALLQAEGVVLDDENTVVEKVKIIYSKQADFNMVLGI